MALAKKILKKRKGMVYSCRTNIAILGASGVGKSTIARSFALNNNESVSYKPTLSELYKRNLALKSDNGIVCNHQLYLLDTSGALRTDFPDTYKKTIEICEAFVLVFSMDDTNSFTELQYILEDIDKIKKTLHTPILIVANKNDLVISKNAAVAKEKIAYVNRGCCFQKNCTEEYVDCFVSLLTRIEKRKGIDRSFYGVHLA